MQLHQLRKRRFRPIAILQLPFYMVYWVLAVIIGLALSIVDQSTEGSDGALSLPSPRFYAYWQELQVVLVSSQSTVMARAAAKPQSTSQVEAMIASVLDAAHRQGLMVIQAVDAEVIERWYGGMPLMAGPTALEPSMAEAMLREAGLSITHEAQGWVVRRPSRPVHRLGQMVWLGAFSLVFPLGIWLSSYRRIMKEHAVLMIAGETEATVLQVGRDGMLVCRSEQGSRKTTLFAIPAAHLIAIGFAPMLLCDRDVTRAPARLRFVTLAETAELPLHLQGQQGAALRDLLVAVMLQQWHGVVTVAQRASHCPYCGSCYVFSIGQSCPSCGGWPSQVVR